MNKLYTMKKFFILTLALINSIALISCTAQTKKMNNQAYKITKTDAEWKAELSPEQYNVLRENSW